jgi:hypothetical protein
MKSTAIVMASAAFLGLCSVQDASAQGKDVCASYAAAVVAGPSGSVPVVADALLVNWKAALACLVPIVTGMKDTMKSGSVSAPTRAKYLSAAGAIRAIGTKIGAAEQANNALPAEQRIPNIDSIATFQTESARFSRLTPSRFSPPARVATITTCGSLPSSSSAM